MIQRRCFPSPLIQEKPIKRKKTTSMRSCTDIAISNNVGGVKHCLSTLRPALGKERHFALADGFRFPTKGSLAIVAVRNSVRPNHLFDHNRDHDYYFELPVRGV